jgi:hypothetical protein
MPFARDIARELFGANRVVIGTEPELAIARGLALAGQIGFRAAGFRVDVTELLESGQVETLVRNRLPVLGEGHGVARHGERGCEHCCQAAQEIRAFGV